MEKDLMLCEAYSIAVNHQHSMFKPKSSQDFSHAKQIINGGTSHEYNKKFPLVIKNKNYFWGDVKTLKIYSKEVYWKIIGYIIGNLLKHREVKNFEELYHNPFSSFKKFADQYGRNFAEELVLNVIEVPDLENNVKEFIREVSECKSLKP